MDFHSTHSPTSTTEYILYILIDSSIIPGIDLDAEENTGRKKP